MDSEKLHSHRATLRTALRRLRLSAALCGCLVAIAADVPWARAELPIDVQRATAEGDHVTALVRFSRLPRGRLTTPAILAAARSAWALSLTARADDLFAQAAQQRGLTDEEHGDILLSRGVIAFQDGHFEVAKHYAGQLVSIRGLSPVLESKGRVLWAEALFELGELAAAEHQYVEALEKTSPSIRGGVEYRLGLCELRLGKQREAMQHLERVPLEHPDAASAVRALGEAAYNTGEWADALFWLQTGRSRFPDNFLDSWTDFVLVRAALAQGKLKDAGSVLEQAEARFGSGDPWITLARATFTAAQVGQPLQRRGG